ncbi:MAG: hypothetical protein IKV57_01570 [Clostridia bacterium]|nr:hypothetical protein [Clostridia bacterium]
MNTTMPGKGYLRIWVTEAGGSLPVRGVPVQIRDEAGNILQVLRTGESGLTPTVELPAPPASESRKPESSVRPYADYRVMIDMPGYVPVLELSVPVFDGITSLQPVNLLPLADPQGSRNAAPYLLHPQVPYQRIRQGSTTPEDPLQPEEGRRPIANLPDSEDIPDFTMEEGALDDNDLPDYGRGHA